MRLRFRVFVLVLSFILFWSVFSKNVFAGPVFLNRQTYPLQLGLTEIGQFHNNALKTFSVWTQWNNPSTEKITITLTFSFYDKDSANSQLGEDGQDDLLMTMKETVTIPEQVSNWGRSFQLTAIGQKLNQGFDHPEEGAGLELYLDAQVISVQHLPPE